MIINIFIFILSIIYKWMEEEVTSSRQSNRIRKNLDREFSCPLHLIILSQCKGLFCVRLISNNLHVNLQCTAHLCMYCMYFCVKIVLVREYYIIVYCIFLYTVFLYTEYFYIDVFYEKWKGLA